jgi:HK97 family phage major capsid protein
MKERVFKPFNLRDHEVKEYSLARALRSIVFPAMREADSLEIAISNRAISEEVAGADAEKGIFIPFAALARDLTVGTATAGGHTVATELQSYIDVLRATSHVVNAGATVLKDLRGNVAIPRATGTSTAQWVAENAAPAESQPSFDQVTLTPKTVSAYTDISRRLLLQSSKDVMQLVAGDLMAVIGTALDSAAINGPGSGNQPTGLLFISGVGSVAGGTNGAAPTFDNVVDLESAVGNANVPEVRMGFLTNTKVRGKLQKTQMFGGTNGIAVWQRSDDGSDRLNGRKAYASNNVPSNLTKGTSTGVCSAIIYGNWVDLLIGIWGAGVTVMVDPYTNAASGAIRLIVMLDCDIAVRHPESFSAMKDALTT